MRAPTIRDVADRAGVSKSLVSLVLRGSDKVRAEKRDAVLKAVRELDYRPNAAARSLSERRTLPHSRLPSGEGTPMIGVLLDDLRNPWYVDLLDGLNALLSANGLHTLLADARLDRRAGHDLAGPFLDLRADGLVVVGTLPDPAALDAVAARVPVVVAGARASRCRPGWTSSPTTTSGAPGWSPSTSSASATARSRTSRATAPSANCGAPASTR
ncbi:DNA-binding LacI/PurR family transcriptional regulator [Streptomyces phaeoluteigriseus]